MKLIKLEETPSVPVSHDPQIEKQVMIEPGVIPGLTKFSRAIIGAGQSVSAHSHDSYEILFLLTGKGQLAVNGTQTEILPNQCIVIEPGEIHSIYNITEDIEVIYFGIEK